MWFRRTFDHIWMLLILFFDKSKPHLCIFIYKNVYHLQFIFKMHIRGQTNDLNLTNNTKQEFSSLEDQHCLEILTHLLLKSWAKRRCLKILKNSSKTELLFVSHRLALHHQKYWIWTYRSCSVKGVCTFKLELQGKMVIYSPRRHKMT